MVRCIESGAQGESHPGEVSQLLTATTGHLSQVDKNRLRQLTRQLTETSGVDTHQWIEAKVPGGFVLPLYGGWLIRVFGDVGDGSPLPTVEEFAEVGLSVDFANLMTFAANNRFCYVRLDRDAEECRGLRLLEDPDEHLAGTPWMGWRAAVALQLGCDPIDLSREDSEAYEHFNQGMTVRTYVVDVMGMHFDATQ